MLYYRTYYKSDMTKSKKKNNKTPGPNPETLKLSGSWEDRVKEALRRKRPKGGWPKPEKPEKPREKD